MDIRETINSRHKTLQKYLLNVQGGDPENNDIHLVLYNEHQLLACAMKHPKALLATGLEARHFYSSSYQIAWKAIENLSVHIRPGEEVDHGSFVAECVKLEGGVVAESEHKRLLHSLSSMQGLGINEVSPEYALSMLIPEITARKQLQTWGPRFEELCERVPKSADPMGLIQDFRSEVRRVAQEPEAGKIGKSILQIAREYDLADKHTDAVPLGISKLDTPAGGGHAKGELMVIGAGTSVGKTYTAARILTNQGKAGRSALYVSVEDPDILLMARVMADYDDALVPWQIRQKIVDPHVFDGATKKLEQDGGGKIYFLDARKWTATQICAAIRRHKYLFNIDLVIVDYLQAVQADDPTNNTANDTAKNVTMLKVCAQDVDVALIIMSQLARDEYRSGAEPTINSCKWAGEIENDAEIMLLMWKDEDDRLHAKIAKLKWNKSSKLRFIVHTNTATGTILEFEDDFAVPEPPGGARQRPAGARPAAGRSAPRGGAPGGPRPGGAA